MIEVIEKNKLRMYKGDTGTISFKLTGDSDISKDTFVFLIKHSLKDEGTIFSQEFNQTEFTVEVDTALADLLDVGKYFWGLKLRRVEDEKVLVDTLIGSGEFNIVRGI